MDVIPFDAGPVGRLWLGRRETLSPDVRWNGEAVSPRTGYSLLNRMEQAGYLLQQIFSIY
jgi:hypothetical protein